MTRVGQRESKESGSQKDVLLRSSFLALLLSLLCCPSLQAETPAQQNATLEKVSFVQNLNAQVPLNTLFQNEAGETVPLSTYFGKKPVLLNLVYFECPMLCTEVLNGTVRSLGAIPLRVGKEFNVVTISFDARETSRMAASKKAVYLDRYGHAEAKNGWSFLVGKEPSIKAVADAIGFHYVYDKELDQFAHASGIVILTPEGRVSHYFFGVEYPSQDVRLSLVEAGHGVIGSKVDQLLLYCYHYDPTTGRYGLAIMRVMRVAGLATVFLLIAFVVMSHS